MLGVDWENSQSFQPLLILSHAVRAKAMTVPLLPSTKMHRVKPKWNSFLFVALVFGGIGIALLQFQQLEPAVITAHHRDTPYHHDGSPSSCDPNVLYRGPAGLPPLRHRRLLGDLLQARNLTDGAEVGVQSGLNAADILSRWKTCTHFALIDLWAQQTNYRDIANVDNSVQNQLYQETKQRLAPWASITTFYRMLSTEAAQQHIANTSLDFVYVDARHDYCGVMEDIEAYWPKLRPGGIMAGHDYVDAHEVRQVTPDQDWSICADGTVNPRAVKGAVEDFAARHGLVVSVMYADGDWPSWMLQKPTTPECIYPSSEER